MKLRNGLLALCAVVAAGCGREQGVVSQHAQAALAPAGAAGVADASFAMTSPAAAALHRFARLPDRGELASYHPDAVRKHGAYTWYRADISEAHALDAIGGTLRVIAPNGTPLAFRYDRHVEHASGDWTWIGHIAGRPELQAVLTFGANAAFGEIAQPDARPLRLTIQDGASWLMATDARVLAGQINAYTRPQASDALVVPREMLRRGRSGSAQALAASQLAVGTGTGTVDLVLGYTPGMVQMLGSASAVQTRLNYLVDLTNQAYANSAVNAQVRLVKTLAVTYTETNNNDIALEQLSGYHAGSGGSDPSKWITPDPAFNALRAARETYGADLVSLVRRFQDPEQTSCGVAWLLGGGKQGITAGDGWDQLGYSVVSDTNGNGSGAFPDNGYICEDHTLAHELGHNMGSAHDRTTAQGDDGVLNDPDDYGAYAYSFGYKSKVIGANFYTIMAYGDSGQISYLVFSNPRITFCGGKPCGTATFEDNARSLSQTIPVVSGFRPTVVPLATAYSDFDGDGASDIFWRNLTDGRNSIWKSANSSTSQPVATANNLDWVFKGIGDFDGDGHADVLWRNMRDGRNSIWPSANSANARMATAIGNLDWIVAGIGDIDGDGQADLFWHNQRDGRNTIWRSANSATAQVATTVANLDWVVAGLNDFDGDGKADVLWHNTRDGRNSIWKSANAATALAVTTIGNLDWVVAGTGDFDGDGRADILWHNKRDARNTIWRSANSATPQAVQTIPNFDWTIAMVGDFDGDRTDDILWRNMRDGRNSIWRSGNSATSQAITTLGNLAWRVMK